MKIEVEVLKAYSKPEIKIDSFFNNDIIATSEVRGRYLKTTVAGNEGKSYGQQNVSIYEFFFANKMEKHENPLHSQFDSAVRVIEKLIADGVRSGEFVCPDPKGAARNIMYVLEGLRVMSQTVGITEKTVNKEILYLMKGIINEQ